MAELSKDAARRVALLRLHAALNERPEPNRATRRAAAAGARKKGRAGRGA